MTDFYAFGIAVLLAIVIAAIWLMKLEIDNREAKDKIIELEARLDALSSHIFRG